MDQLTLSSLLRELRALPRETEWVEFKVNNSDPQDIGEYLSALANSARLVGKMQAYLVWGVEDGTHRLVGTTFDFHNAKQGNQDLESWLTGNLTPKLHLGVHQWTEDGKPVVLIEVPAALQMPVRWKGEAHIRVSSHKARLKDFPEKERELWKLLEQSAFEDGMALQGLTPDEVLDCINDDGYFRLLGQSRPSERTGIIERLIAEKIIVRTDAGAYDVTNLGAILFARKLSLFPRLARKAVRVIAYVGAGRLQGKGEFVLDQGNATGFPELLREINARIPVNEVIGQALREEVPMYPPIAIRELVANALIHQDLTLSGTSPIIEIFTDRMEISNPGVPLIDTQRFLDITPRSRNEALASLMRRMNICEERGTGIDKTIHQIEVFQLPAPNFATTDHSTVVTLYSHQSFTQMGRQDRVRACYQHAGLRWVFNQQMTNASLRERFGLPEESYTQVSRILKEAREANLIKPYDPDNTSSKFARYVPYWA
nr:ATP-binding protein [Armatimonas sp.]